MNAHSAIVVGVDYSKCSAAALREAARQATRSDSQIVAVHSVDHDIFERIHRHVALSVDEVIEKSRGSVEAFIAETIGKNHNVRIEVHVGKPSRDILRVCKDEKASLLILGQQGDFAVGDETGSVALKCTRKAATKVMLVKKGHEGEFKKVAVAIGLSDSAPTVFSDALVAAKCDDAPLAAFHVFQPAQDLSREYALFSQLLVPHKDAGHSAEDLQLLKRLTKDKFAGAINETRVDYSVVEGQSVPEGIVDFIEGNQIDLLVIGSKDGQTWKKALLGSNVEKLLRKCPCSVLVSRVD